MGDCWDPPTFGFGSISLQESHCGFQGFDLSFSHGLFSPNADGALFQWSFWDPKDGLNGSKNICKFLLINTSCRLCILGGKG